MEELGRLFEDDEGLGLRIEKMEGIEPQSETGVVNVDVEKKA